MRHLCHQCINDEGIVLELTIAVRGTVKCDSCGIPLKDGEIHSVSEDGIMAGYFKRLAKTKLRAREAVKDMISRKVTPLEVYIYKERGITLMVPVNETMSPVQIADDVSAL